MSGDPSPGTEGQGGVPSSVSSEAHAAIGALARRAEAVVSELPDGVRADARALLAGLPALLAHAPHDAPEAIAARVTLRGFAERLGRREAEGIGFATLARAASALSHGSARDALQLAGEAERGLARLGV